MVLLELKSEEMFLKTLKNGSSVCQLMGDNFIGFKFIGEGADYWNTLLSNTYPEGFVLTSDILVKNEISFVPYDNTKW